MWVKRALASSFRSSSAVRALILKCAEASWSPLGAVAKARRPGRTTSVSTLAFRPPLRLKAIAKWDAGFGAACRAGGPPQPIAVQIRAVASSPITSKVNGRGDLERERPQAAGHRAARRADRAAAR